MPRFERVDDRRQQLDRVAWQVQEAVRVKLVVGDGAVLNLQDGAMPRTTIAAEQVQHVTGANLGQVVLEQHDLWLSDLGNPHGGDAIGGLVDMEARLVKHGGQVESRPLVVVCNQHADALASTHRSMSIDLPVD